MKNAQPQFSFPLIGATIAATLLFAAPRSVCAQTGNVSATNEGAAAPVVSSDTQARLDSALKDLDKVIPQLDPESQKMAPAFRAIFRRVILEKDTVTTPEMRLYSSLRKMAQPAKARAFERDMPGPISSLMDGMPGVNTKPIITVGQHKLPGSNGATVGFVRVRIGGRQKTVAEIPTGAGGLSPLQRARRVSERIESAAKSSPLWWTELGVAQQKYDYIVSAPEAPDGCVITADRQFARIRQASPARLATQLMRDIRYVYGGDPAVRSRALPTAQEEAENAMAAASDCREQGDAAYDAGDLAGAEKAYREAIQQSASYIPAYERLIDLYTERKETAKCRAIAQQAAALPGLDDTQRQKFVALAQ